MMRGVWVGALVVACAAALPACSSDKSSSSGTAGAAGSAGAATAGSAGTAGSTSGDQGGGAAMPTSSCSDGIKNGTETDVDCGNDCSQCALDKACVAFSDCASAHCVAGMCKECTPGAMQCSADGTKISTCSTDGKWVDAATTCPNGCDVETGACKP